MPSSTTKSDVKPEESRCAICQQTNCDIQIIGCSCLLHTTCLPLDILFAKQPMRTNYGYQHTFCPSCRRSPIMQIRVLPLPTAVLEEAARLREKDNEILSIQNNEVSSLACGSPAHSIALFNGTNKRPFASKSPITRSYRTGRWSPEESAYTDKLIKTFDAGLLPLPHGIKLNDFLCDLLSCRTSRLTKKLKNAKLSARTYHSWASGNTMGAFSSKYVGGDIQRAQTLFLKMITPDWVRMELQFNISRMWRTHLANFCLQISYLQLDTKQWFASLDSIDYIVMSCNDTKIQARRKRMKSALTEDANAAARTAQPLSTDASNDDEDDTEVACTSNDKEGVFVGGMPFQRLSSLNLKSLAEDEDKAGTSGITTDIGKTGELSPQKELTNSLNRSNPKELNAQLASVRKFSFDHLVIDQPMKNSTSLSSFVELFSPDLRPSKSSSRTTSSIDINASSSDEAKDKRNEEFEISATTQQEDSEVDNFIEEAIDSVLESSSSEKEYQGLFLKEVSKFLIGAGSSFQHVDLWVPMDVSHSDIVGKKHIGGSSTMSTTSSSKVTGIIYGDQQGSSVRLSNAGYITVGGPPQTINRLNEFGMYSKNFSFSPGFGVPGRVYLSRIPCWQNNLSLLKPEHFARAGGAKIYGVSTCLCIPINTPIGTMVVALYSTQNLSRDMVWEKKCMQYLWKLKPEPKWKLTIDVGLKTSVEEAGEFPDPQDPASSPKTSSANNQCFVIPPSPTAVKNPHPSAKPPAGSTLPSNLLKHKKPTAAFSFALHGWNEQSLALLIGKYMPLDRNLSPNPVANDEDVAGSLMSLRLLLLRHPSCRNNAESRLVSIIMSKFQSYACSNKQEPDLILSIVKDWKQLAVLPSSIKEEQSGNLPSNHLPAAKSVNYVGKLNSCSSNFGFSNNSSMKSPSPNSIPSVGLMPSINQFSLPLAAFGNNGLQSIADVASSISEQNNVSRHQFEETINVPRVVSEQGPIENK